MAKILIIEDEKALNEAYQIVLKKAKYKVLAAYNGQEGLDVFKSERPDLVLLDLRMPQMDGVEFLKRLDPLKNYPGLQIIIFSNFDDQAEIDSAFKYGATRYMLKAWSSPAELIKVVKETLEREAES
jgi:DNA-binding response OmpR family regulator